MSLKESEISPCPSCKKSVSVSSCGTIDDGFLLADRNELNTAQFLSGEVRLLDKINNKYSECKLAYGCSYRSTQLDPYANLKGQFDF